MLQLEAWRHGMTLQIDRLEGSILEPITLGGAHWSYESRNGAVTRIEIAEATAEFRWRNLFERGEARWFRRLTLDGVAGKISVPLQTMPEARQPLLERYLPRRFLLAAPERIEAHDVDFVLQTNGGHVRIERASFTASEMAPGKFAAGQLVVTQPWLHQTFRDLRGTTKLEGSEVQIAHVLLQPGVEVQSISAELDDLARGRLNVVGQLAAFDGCVRIEAQTLAEEQPFTVEITGTFSQINVAKLAAFLALSNAAGGTIKDGKFIFRGSPQHPARATASLRLDAANFQWDARQWDSLVLGATLLDRHVQVPKLALVQGHNRLDIDGEIALPEPGRAWWQSEFEARVSARIENLTELSALMLPEFTYAAGRATIDGSVRGKGEKFDGQLIVAGSDLQWRDAPIQELHAALKFNGNEVQISNLSVFNDGDFVRGRGVVNILGPSQYWGELHASVQDLATYAALLRPPAIAEPLAGGAVVDWTGEGSARGHTGNFMARLKRVRSVGATASLRHPIDANFDGSYARASIVFNRFALSDDESAFTANVIVGEKTVSLRDIRLLNRGSVWLDGDAVLPLNVWRAWPGVQLDDSTPGSVHLHARKLSLHEASRLTGWNFPIEGILDGSVAAEGPLLENSKLQTSGALTVSGATLPLGWNGCTLSGVAGAVRLEGHKMIFEKVAGHHATGNFRAAGSIDFKNVRDPALQISIASDRMRLPVFQGAVDCDVALDLSVAGPWSGALVAGTARPLLLSDGRLKDWDLSSLWLESPAPQLPPAFAPAPAPFASWRFDIACRAAQPLPLAQRGSQVLIDGRIAGSGAAPLWIGNVSFSHVATRAGDTPLDVEEAALTFRENDPHHPTLALACRGAVFGKTFAARLTGPLSQLLREIDCTPPLTARVIRGLLSGRDTEREASESRFSLRAPAILSGGAEVFDWRPIGSPPAEPNGVSQ